MMTPSTPEPPTGEILGLPERHHAVRLLRELCRPASAAVIAALPARADAGAAADTVRERTGLSVKEFWTAVGRLVDLGLIRRTDGRLAVARDELDRISDRWVRDSPLPAIVDRHPTMAPFVQSGRVTRMPTEPRLIDDLYAGLAELFEPGETLTEAQVGDRIGRVHDDPAEIRRGLVDRGRLIRRPGSPTYHRPGR